MKKLLVLILLCFAPFAFSQHKVDGSYNPQTHFFIQMDKHYWISEFKEGFAKISVGGYYGIIDTLGTVILPIKYDEVYITEKGLYGKLGARKFAFDKKGSLNPADYFGPHVNGDVYMYVPEFDKYDFTFYGKPYSEGFFRSDIYKDADGSYHLAYFDDTGTPVLSLKQYSKGMGFSGGLACVFNTAKGKWGFINKKGQEVIEAQFDHAAGFRGGMANLCKNGKCGLIDTEGKTILPFEYDIVYPLLDGLASVKKDGKMGFVNAAGAVVIPLMYDDTQSFHDGFTRVKKDGEWFTIDKNNNPNPYFQFSFDEDGYRYMNYNGRRVYENRMGEVIYDIDFENPLYYINGLAKIKVKGKFGYIDHLGNVVVQPIYNDAKDFEFGKALVLKGTEVYFIDKAGNEVYKAAIKKPGDALHLGFGFNHYGFYEVKCEDDKYLLINTDLKEVLPCSFDRISFGKNIIYTELNGKKATFDFEGRPIKK